MGLGLVVPVWRGSRAVGDSCVSAVCWCRAGAGDGAVVSSCCVDWGCVWRDLCGVVCVESGMRVHLRFAGAGRVQDIRDAGISWNRRSGTGMMRESCKIMGCP